MLQYHNEKIPASDPIHLSLSHAKLQQLHPQMMGPKAASTLIPWGKKQLTIAEAQVMLAEHLAVGDSRAAVVIRCNPLLVAAYTDEQDAVLLLCFPPFLVGQYQLQRYSRLLTINTYGKGPQMAADIVEGPKTTHRWTTYYPVIAEFLSDDLDFIQRRKQAINENEWQRAISLGDAAIARPGVLVRNGRPFLTRRIGKPLSELFVKP